MAMRLPSVHTVGRRPTELPAVSAQKPGRSISAGARPRRTVAVANGVRHRRGTAWPPW